MCLEFFDDKKKIKK